MSQAHCDVCGKDQPPENQQPAALWLGSHKKSVHGVSGSSRTTEKRRRRRERGSADRAPRGGPSKGDKKQPALRGEIHSTFKLLGAVVSVVDPYCGDVLENRSGKLADALARVASKDARIERWLRGIGTVGPYGALFLAAGELALPIAAHHGLVAREVAVLVGAPVPPGPEPDPWADHVPPLLDHPEAGNGQPSEVRQPIPPSAEV